MSSPSLVGDASGIQSPLSFGGFASLTRHLPRLSQAFTEALEADCLTKADLGLINAYTPNLSVTWMFQRSMSVPVGSRPHPYLINRGLINTFRAMEQLGEPVLKPFLQGQPAYNAVVLLERVDTGQILMSRLCVAGPGQMSCRPCHWHERWPVR